MSLSRAISRRGAALLCALALLPLGAPSSVLAAPPGECPAILPLRQIAAGMTGEGWTVVKGDVPEKFKVEILGVLPNGIAPGRDLVVIEISDVAGKHFVEAAGGIWAGMSGSPVYLNGKLAGAIAYGLSGATSPVGGMSAAKDMAKLLNYSSSPMGSNALPRQIRVPDALRQTVAARAGVAQAQAGTFSPLPVPVSISGVPGRAKAHLQETLERGAAPVILTSGGSASAAGGTSGHPVPGGNFAAVLAYGSVSAVAIGTTTYVCGDQMLAFGHSYRFAGSVTYGANDANAITIIRDPVFGSFKLAYVAELFGTVDQDRLMGLRADLGDGPDLVLVNARATSLDTGNTRNVKTRPTMGFIVPEAGAVALLAAIDVANDHAGGTGSARVRWTVSGLRQNGNHWSYTNTNRFANTFDVANEAAFAIYDELNAIQNNPYEDITFTSVEIRAWVEDELKQYQVEHVKVSRNGGPYKTVDFLEASPGDSLQLRVRLREYPFGATALVNLGIGIPMDAAGDGALIVNGGGDEDSDVCAVSPQPGCTGGFLGQLAALDSLTPNNSVIATLDLGGFEGPLVVDQDSVATDRATYGSFFIQVFVSP